jgi:hypothetical protein
MASPFRPYNKFNRGYTGRNYHVTDGHEAEALANELAKRPNRFGMFVLRLLGFKGKAESERRAGFPVAPEHHYPEHRYPEHPRHGD